MTNLIELRKQAKELKIRRFSVMKKEELEVAVAEAKKEALYKESVTCQQCLVEQRKQKIIDDSMYYQKTMANFIRRLVCDHCNHPDIAVDGDVRICTRCGTVQRNDTNMDYLSHCKIHK